MDLPATPSSSQPPNTTPTRSRASALCYLLISSAAALPLRLPCFAGSQFPYQLPAPCLLRSGSIRPLILQLFSTLASRSYRRVVRSLPRFWVMLLYFVSTSLLGFLFLKLLAAAPATGSVAPRVPSDLDLFFMAVSAVTVSSMSTAEMGALSTGQFVVLAVLMLAGGEVFTSLPELRLMETELAVVEVSTPVIVVVSADGSTSPAADPSTPGGIISAVATDLADGFDLVELGLAAAPEAAASGDLKYPSKKYKSLKTLGGVVFVYLVLAHVAGAVAILIYLICNPVPRGLLAERGVSALAFSVFMTVSSFANAGFVPLNEGMAPFKQSPGVLLLIAPLVLAGNTLFPPLLRWAVRLSSRAVAGAGELSEYILENSGEIGFRHLLSRRRSACLLFTVAGFVCLQAVAFCWMEWGGAALEGLSAYQKVVGGLYMAVNSRHAGEAPFDLSAVSSAVLVLYVVMMYLPPYTSFVPAMEDPDDVVDVSSGSCRDDDEGGAGAGYLRHARMRHRAAEACPRPPQLQRPLHRRGGHQCIRERGVLHRVQLRPAAEGAGRRRRRRVQGCVVWFRWVVEWRRKVDPHRRHVLRKVEEVHHGRGSRLEAQLASSTN